MVALPIVVFDVFPDDHAKMAFAKRNDVVEAFAANRSSDGAKFVGVAGAAHSSADTQPVALPLLLSHRPTKSRHVWLHSALLPILP